MKPHISAASCPSWKHLPCVRFPGTHLLLQLFLSNSALPACHTHREDFRKCKTKGTFSHKQLKSAPNHKPWIRACYNKILSSWLSHHHLQTPNWVSSAREWQSHGEILEPEEKGARRLSLVSFWSKSRKWIDFFYQMTSVWVSMGGVLAGVLDAPMAGIAITFHSWWQPNRQRMDQVSSPFISKEKHLCNRVRNVDRRVDGNWHYYKYITDGGFSLGN